MAGLFAAMADRPVVRSALQAIQASEPGTLNEQARICEIPAPPFEEKVRAEYFRKKFTELSLHNVRIDT
ncbi:MAG: peptidase M20, partial [Opitutaceae bacterium]